MGAWGDQYNNFQQQTAVPHPTLLIDVTAVYHSYTDRNVCPILGLLSVEKVILQSSGMPRIESWEESSLFFYIFASLENIVVPFSIKVIGPIELPIGRKGLTLKKLVPFILCRPFADHRAIVMAIRPFRFWPMPSCRWIRFRKVFCTCPYSASNLQGQ